MRDRKAILVMAALSFAGMNARATELDSNTITAADMASGGSIQIVSRVYDNYLGDFNKLHYDYEVTNVSFDPTPGTSNGVSGFQVVFAYGVPGVADQYAPGGWDQNLYGVPPPFGAEAIIDNTTGFGIPIGGVGNFGFTTPMDVPWTDIYTGSWAHSWEADLQVNLFSLVELTTGTGILIPLPEPGTVFLLVLGGMVPVGQRRACCGPRM